MTARRSDFDGDRQAEIPVSSPWGLGLLKWDGETLSSPTLRPNGTRFGRGWLLNTADNRFDVMGDFDGDGRVEILVSSPWGMGVLEQSGNTFGCPMLVPNGTRFGGWLLNSVHNRFGPVGDFDGDGRDEILVTSPWGIGIFELSGSTMRVPFMAPNGTRFGGWLLNTADNRFGPVGDFDGDGRTEIVVASPWGIGILRFTGTTLRVVMMAPNGTRFGGWLLNTADNHLGTPADFDGDGRDELLLTSPWGLGILKLSGSGLSSPVMARNGTRFGGWLLNTADNRFGPVGDLDGDGRAELVVTSPWGIGVLRQSGSTLVNPMLAPNATRFGGWLLNTADNDLDMVADVDGDGRDEIVVTSPWGIGVLQLSGNSLRALMLAPNGTEFGDWPLDTATDQFGIGDQLIRLHVKILTEPTISVDEMLVSLRSVFEAVGVRVHRVSTETLDLPLLTDLDVGSCVLGTTTAEQDELFTHRANAGPNDVVVYFVRSTVPPFNGCAAAPAGRPGAVVARGATRWTLAHEVGHVLGLRHADDPRPPDPAAPPAQLDRLMTGRGTVNITNPPPDLVAPEVVAMRGARLTSAV